jgi:hypothetical protein
MKTVPQLLGEIAYIAGCGAEATEYSIPDRNLRARFQAIQELAIEAGELADKAQTALADARSTIMAQVTTVQDYQRLYGVSQDALADARSTIKAQAATIADLQALWDAGVQREVELKREIAGLKAGIMYISNRCEECQAALGQAHAESCAFRNPEEVQS